MSTANQDRARDIDSFISYLRSCVVTPTQEETDFYNNMVIVASRVSKVLSNLVYRCDVHIVSDECSVKTACYVSTPEGKPMILFNHKFFVEHLMPNIKFATLVLLHEIEHAFFKHTEVAKQIFENIKDPSDKKMARLVRDAWGESIDYSVNQSILGLSKSTFYGIQQESDVMKYLGYSKTMPVLCSDEFVGKGIYEIFSTVLAYKTKNKPIPFKSNNFGFKRLGNNVVLFDGDVDDLPDSDESGFDDHFGDTFVLDEDGQLMLMESTNEEYLQHAVRNAYETCKGMGSLSAHDKDLLDLIVSEMTPKVTWTDQFLGVVGSLVKNRQSYKKWNPMSRDGVIRPTRIGQQYRIVYGIDSSGSMNRNTDIVEGFTEFFGLIESFSSWDLMFLTCDSSAHIISKYNSREHDTSDIDLEIRGGGGTDMAPIVDMAQTVCVDEMGDVDGIVIFTDGYIPTRSIEQVYQNRIPLIFVVTSTGARDLSFSNDSIEVIHIN